MYLNCHTYFSLNYGTLSPEQLIAEAKDKGLEVLALTDINNTSATFEFVKLCQDNNIKPVAGIEFRNEDDLLYIGLAKNNEGFRELNEFLSVHNYEQKTLPSTPPLFEHVYIIYPTGKKNIEDLRDNEYVGIRIGELSKLLLSDLMKRQDKLVVLQPVTFKDKTGYNTHRLLRAIHKNALLSKLTLQEQADQDEVMLQMDKLFAGFGNHPRIIKNTMQLLENCSISFDSKVKNKLTFTGQLNDDRLLLRKLAFEGMADRYGCSNKEAQKRVNKELEIINNLGFNAYFLITWDILRYAISRNFSYVGRGSGANSIVSYCLKITDVDPIELDLYFERFLNPYRTSPPDFDIDFSWKDRDQVIDYIFKRYGMKHTVLLATYNTFRGKSIIRELGKVFGLPKHEIDAITSNMRQVDQMKDKDHIVKAIFKYFALIQDFPNYLSIHAGGILISEKPISYYTATNRPPKGLPLTHFDMWTAEDMGFYKYDILSQRGLGHIKDALSIIKKNTGKVIEINTEKAKQDEKVREQIKTAKTIGCFYIESPGMRMLLRKLKCEDYKTLVAASSIIRPGVSQSGMMQQYIYRFHHPEKIEHLHPKMGELLAETFGVMIYQEDVIKVAHYFVGMDLGEADILRRAMSGKYRSKAEFQRIREHFFECCKEKKYSDALAKEVWRQIESFSGYSFSKAHSASFAVESYHSLYLKAHYPLEFCVAVINNFGGFYSTEFYVHEARMAGGKIEAPCVNHSDYFTTLHGKTIYIGFVHVKDLEQKFAQVIEDEREIHGQFKDLFDFTRRIPVNLEQLNILIQVGGFRFTGKSKKVLLMEAALLLAKQKPTVISTSLFEIEQKSIPLPTLRSFSYEDAYDEIELLGFSLCFPFDMLPEENKVGITEREMKSNLGKRVSMVGYLVHEKSLYTIRKELMSFMHFIDKEGGTFDTTHFPPALKRYPLKGKGFYLMKGKVVEEFGYPSLEVDYMEKLPMAKKEVIYESQ